MSQVDDSSSVALHSLRLPKHTRKPSTEADFVLIAKQGVLVLEVKGGRVVRRAGQWVFIDRNDRESISYEGPFAQAEGAMHSLRRRLIELLGQERVESVSFGFAVITPDCTIPASDVEREPAVYIDERGARSASDLSRGIDRALEHWLNKPPEHGRRPLKQVDIEGLAQACRPDFEAVVSLAAGIAGVNIEMVRLTERQLMALDGISGWDRVIIEGAAGTGKTLIAVEAARRSHEQGGRTLLTVRSPVLAASLRKSLPSEVMVVPHRALGSVRDKIDALILDEAQDVMTEGDLITLDGMLERGLEGGTWTALLDPAGQRGVIGGFDPDVYGLLQDYADGRPLVLSQNIRNARNVADETALVTGFRGARPIVESPGRVRTHFVADPEEEASVIRSIVRELRREGVDDAAVTLLTPDGAGRFFGHLPGDFRQQIATVGVASALSWPTPGLSSASIPDFKGMENDVVIVADLWDLDVAGSRTSLYTAMTRPRAELHIIWPAAMRDAVESEKVSNVAILGG